ncbi:MAG: penicillin-binding protein 2 [Acidimicrobiales bacterium]
MKARGRAAGGPPRPAAPPSGLDEEGRPERSRSRPHPQRLSISTSPLKRLDDEERELARRSETVHLGLRLSGIGVVVLALFAVVVFRLWSLQVLQGGRYQAEANDIVTRTVPVTPPRGLILARGGQILVGDKVMPVVTLNRQIAVNDPGVVRRLAVALGITVGSIETDLANQQDSIYEPVPVRLGATTSEVVFLSEHRSQFPGVAVSYIAERRYPQGSLGAQMLGYVADITASELKVLQKKGYVESDVVGQSGIEASYESFLHGHPGTETLHVDAQGIPVGSPKVKAPAPGGDVVLNVDLGLERAVTTALQNQLTALQSAGLPADSGAVVVENPQDGAIDAMVSLPTYDPRWFVGGISESHYREITSASGGRPFLDRATQGLYTPGSTFKLATATAALDDGLISPYSTIVDPGSFTIPGCTGGQCTFLNNDGEVLGPLDISTAITASDDVFFYTLGYDFWAARAHYGLSPIQKAAAAYGLGQPTGVDLPDPYVGQVDSPELRKYQHEHYPKAFPYDYYGAGDQVNMAFGQGETVVTPLELANAYATFANGGTRYAPEVAAGVVSPTGKVLDRVRPKVLGHVRLPPSTYDAIFSGLKGVITNTAYGTAAGTFAGYPYQKLPLAGKTGTATTSNNPNAQPTALFVAFGPANGSPKAPRYVVAVVIPEAGYGAAASAPVVRSIFQYLIRHPVGPVRMSAPSPGS